MVNAHEIKQPLIRMPIYIIGMPIAILLLISVFIINGMFGAMVGMVSGFIDCASDGNRLLEKRFWVGCYRGFTGAKWKR